MSQDEINVGLFEEVKKLRNELDKVTVERDDLSNQLCEVIAGLFSQQKLAKRDLEQQAKGVQLAQESLSFNSLSKDTVAIHELIDLEQDLRKQTNEFNKNVDTSLNKG